LARFFGFAVKAAVCGENLLRDVALLPVIEVLNLAPGKEILVVRTHVRPDSTPVRER